TPGALRLSCARRHGCRALWTKTFDWRKPAKGWPPASSGRKQNRYCKLGAFTGTERTTRMAYLDTQPLLGYPLAACVGLAVGSFLNVVILRLPRRLEWEWKRDAREILEEPELYEPPPPGIVVEPSHDPATGDRLKWWENIPVLSWLMLRGRSRYSGQRISVQYPLVELLTGLLTVACVWRFGFGWQGFGAMLLTWYLIALSGIDLRTRLLPDQLTLPLMWLGLIASLDNLYMPAK